MKLIYMYVGMYTYTMAFAHNVMTKLVSNTQDTHVHNVIRLLTLYKTFKKNRLQNYLLDIFFQLF